MKFVVDIMETLYIWEADFIEGIALVISALVFQNTMYFIISDFK